MTDDSTHRPSTLEEQLEQARQDATRHRDAAILLEAQLHQAGARLADQMRWGMEQHDRAARAEAATERVRALAIAAKERADRSFSRQFGGAPFPAFVSAVEVLAALDQPATTVEGQQP